MKDFSNALDFRVIGGVCRTVGVDAKSVDRAFMARVECCRGVGAIGNIRIQGMRHLMAKYWEFVHLHLGLILAIDALMSDQSSGSDHVCGHSISDEKQNILSSAGSRYISNKPRSDGLCTAVVGQCRSVCSWLVQSHMSVRLSGHIDNRRFLGISSKQVWSELSIWSTRVLLA